MRILYPVRSVLNMGSHERSRSPASNERPSKTRRANRACLQCRSRKQRCLPQADETQAPCQRCSQLGASCSFEIVSLTENEDKPTPSQMAEIVVNLQKRLLVVEERVRSLQTGGAPTNDGIGLVANVRVSQEPHLEPDRMMVQHASTSGPSISRAQPSTLHSHNSHAISPSYSSYHRDTVPISSPHHDGQPAVSMSTIKLGAPIATLRSLGALPANGSESMLDPIAQSVLSVLDAQRAIKIFFDHCHSFGPVLDKVSVNDGMRLRHQNPPLFLTICTIGARYWDSGISQDQGPLRERGLHPSFLELTTLLDITIQLILRPMPSDVTLDSIRALLLYAQWMPPSREHLFRATKRSSEGSENQRAPRSRYNDISAWAVLGLAQRYALFLGPDRLSVLRFQDPHTESITPTDMARLRIWHNLITCDCNLMLTSGLPASLDPSSAVRVGRTFSEQQLAQLPEDKRVTALVELVGITHRAMMGREWDLGGRPLDLVSLKKINVEFDDWLNIWVHRLKDTPHQHNALPFTSVRWYRLSLNSASLGPLLSPSPPPSPDPSAHSPFLQPLHFYNLSRYHSPLPLRSSLPSLTPPPRIYGAWHLKMSTLSRWGLLR
ncbi:hypothetical protein L202_04412 [Cryptococcus amylolentus CBS 6039]|uniref:Zn(2)-C6 fungal-type domain-containing protein n=1 Tax=Cryptococcus amylolentus CBS 6039 TaxID=1295533 RepID=A0A1E3HT70_9TREE|nr:hypothetical protein L202_04412 [Cryptococcus amylolentus CBS 6039]ODN78876.1 hypothetical protein L202_04412 [Cryptococcus amylolentus CBS 6039]